MQEKASERACVLVARNARGMGWWAEQAAWSSEKCHEVRVVRVGQWRKAAHALLASISR